MLESFTKEVNIMEQAHGLPIMLGEPPTSRFWSHQGQLTQHNQHLPPHSINIESAI
jgi:hypothetical protein